MQSAAEENEKINKRISQDPQRTRYQHVEKTTEGEETSSDLDGEYLQLTSEHVRHYVKSVKSSKSKDKLQTDLEVKGKFQVILRNKNRGIKTKFLVVKGNIDSPPLICKKTLLDLGMLEIEPEGTLRETNELRIKTVKPQATDELQRLLTEYNEVFEGIGCFKEKKTGEEIEVKPEIIPEAKPVAQKPRRVAYHLQKPLKECLEEGVEKKIFEKVPACEPITWCSPLVVQPKPKFTEIEKDQQESHMIRAIIDMRIPNESM